MAWVLPDRNKKVIKKIGVVFLYIISLLIFAYVGYLPTYYFTHVGHETILAAGSIENKIISLSTYKIKMTLIGLIYLVGPMTLYGWTFVLQKFQRRHLQKIGRLLVFYSVVAMVIFIVLLWLDIKWWIYQDGGEARIGFIFHFMNI